MPIATMAKIGGEVRVGLEDSLWSEPDKLATNNAEQVRKLRMIIDLLSLEIATPDETRSVLKLKGRGACTRLIQTWQERCEPT